LCLRWVGGCYENRLKKINGLAKVDP